jgi:hypothetical protein
MTELIDGKAVAKRIRTQVAADVAAAYPSPEQAPGLATILVGEDPASAVYVAKKRRAVREAGMRDLHRSLPKSSTQEQVAAVLDELAADPAVSGILLQLPLPKGLDSAAPIERIPAWKDVDGLTTTSAGLWPCGAIPDPGASAAPWPGQQGPGRNLAPSSARRRVHPATATTVRPGPVPADLRHGYRGGSAVACDRLWFMGRDEYAMPAASHRRQR